ncbi:MAG: hypothetical protein WCO79_02850 [bacterium]
MRTLLLSILSLCVISVAFPLTVFSAVMSSGSYQIQLDSVNVGGLDSASASYASQDTLGETGSGGSASASYNLNAGYQQMEPSSISITSPSGATMGAVSGFSGGTSNGSTTWTVITDNSAGYSLSVRASSAPAMLGQLNGSFIANYVPATSDPDYTFGVGSASSVFAYTPEGNHVVQRYKDNGAACNVGSGTTADACWDGFSTSNVQVSGSASANMPSGTDTTLKYRVGIGASKFQDSGTYEATIIVTATTL